MGRNSNGLGIVFSVVNTAIKANAKYRRNVAAQDRAQRAHAHAVERAERQYEKAQQKLYLSQRELEAINKTAETEQLFQYLNTGIIPDILNLDIAVNFESLKPKFEPPVFSIPNNLCSEPIIPEEQSYISAVGKKPLLGAIFKSLFKKWEKKIEDAKVHFQKDLSFWRQSVEQRESEIGKLLEEFKEKSDVYQSEYDFKCQEIESYRSNYLALDIDSVTSYVELVLDSSDYIIDWEREYNISYSKESKEMLIEYRLPDINIIPNKRDYRYIKLLDTIEPRPRKKADIDSCYKSLISSIALRTIYEVLKSDFANAISVITFNGYIVGDNPINGRQVNATVISILVTKSEFAKIDFSNIIPTRCIQGLSAVISPSLNELVAVKPIREYSMLDKRFVEEEDVISTLDTRPNLMDLNPYEFENLVSNLFSKMGLETKQTRTSKDGGVDAIAFDTRPIVGGKLVIQAKRYKNTVGVSAVRDLYGTLLNEGASKGILVTTSSYGPDAYTFSKDKPIELIDGGGLLYLLKQVGIRAKIVMPDVWEYDY